MKRFHSEASVNAMKRIAPQIINFCIVTSAVYRRRGSPRSVGGVGREAPSPHDPRSVGHEVFGGYGGDGERDVLPLRIVGRLSVEGVALVVLAEWVGGRRRP